MSDDEQTPPHTAGVKKLSIKDLLQKRTPQKESAPINALPAEATEPLPPQAAPQAVVVQETQKSIQHTAPAQKPEKKFNAERFMTDSMRKAREEEQAQTKKRLAGLGQHTVDMSTAYAVSQQGRAALRLNVVQQEARPYPRGYFGVDEVWLFFSHYLRIAKRSLAKCAEKPQPFSVAIHVIGSHRVDFALSYDGQKLHPTLTHLPEKFDAEMYTDADLVIDYMRCKIHSHRYELDDKNAYHGNIDLLFTLGWREFSIYSDHLDELLEVMDEKLPSVKKDARDGADLFVRQLQQMGAPFLSFIEQPTALRVLTDDLPPVDILIHIQKGQMGIMRAKPGESLPAGDIEMHVQKRGLEALFKEEIHYRFMLMANLVQIKGDLQRLSRLYLMPPLFMSYLRHYQKGGVVPSDAHPFLTFEDNPR